MPKVSVFEYGVFKGIEDTRTLEEAKGDAIFYAGEAYTNSLSLGYTDAILGITIGIDSASAQSFVNDLAGVEATLNSGITLENVAIADLDGNFHTLTVNEYRALISRAWMASRNLWAIKAMKESAIKGCNSISEVDSLGGN